MHRASAIGARVSHSVQGASPMSADDAASLFSGIKAPHAMPTCKLHTPTSSSDIGASPVPSDLAVPPPPSPPHRHPPTSRLVLLVPQALLQWRDAALPLQDYVTLPSAAIRSIPLPARKPLTLVLHLLCHTPTAHRSAAHLSLSLPSHLVAFASNVDGDLLVLDSGSVREWCSGTGAGALPNPSHPHCLHPELDVHEHRPCRRALPVDPVGAPSRRHTGGKMRDA